MIHKAGLQRGAKRGPNTPGSLCTSWFEITWLTCTLVERTVHFDFCPAAPWCVNPAMMINQKVTQQVHLWAPTQSLGTKIFTDWGWRSIFTGISKMAIYMPVKPTNSVFLFLTSINYLNHAFTLWAPQNPDPTLSQTCITAVWCRPHSQVRG